MSAALERVLDALRNHGLEPRRSGSTWTCRCPSHDDRNPSLSVAQGDDGRALVHCHAGCAPADICRALRLNARDLFDENVQLQAGDRGQRSRRKSRRAPAPGRSSNQREPGRDTPLYPTPDAAIAALESKLGPPSARWRYHNDENKLVGLIVRWDTPGGKVIRPVSRRQDGKAWMVGGMPVPRPLYGLPALRATAAGDRVYVTEGEKAADAATVLGLLVTTSPHGAKSASHADWSALRDRDVVIMPDNDVAGDRYATDVAQLAMDAGARCVRVVKLAASYAELPDGGDVADLVAHSQSDEKSLAALRSQIEKLADEAPSMTTRLPTSPPNGRTDWGTPGMSDADLGEPSKSERVVRLVLDLYRLGQTQTREPFAVPHEGPNVLVLLEPSGRFYDTTAREYRRRFGEVMTAAAFKDALAALRGYALEEATESASLRTGTWNESVVLDLGSEDGAAVVIDRSGWRIVDRSPILFRRTALTGHIPKPQRGGSLDQLRRYLNVNDDTWPVLMGWMVAALIPNIPHPILLLGGTQGSGKTSAARFICGLFDASAAPTRSQPRDPADWAVSAENAWTTVIDNVSRIPEWLSDALCKCITGDAWTRRKLYTNSDVSVLSFLRVIVLTSIDAGALRGDLGERIALADLEPIDPENRRAEADLASAYRAAHPAMLGALLDLLATVLAGRDNVRLRRMPRMADFARVLAAMDSAIGTNALELYEQQSSRVSLEVVESDAVGEALIRFMETRATWQGNMSELLAELEAPNDCRDWPRNGRALSARLKRLSPALLQQGVKVTPPARNDRTRVYTISTTARTAQPLESAGLGDGVAVGVQADATSASPDRPADRPSGREVEGSKERDSGRSGGSGGSSCDPERGDDEWGDL